MDDLGPSIRQHGPAKMTAVSTALFFLKVGVRAVWCTLTVLFLLCTYFSIVVPLLPIRYAWPRAYWFIEGRMFRWLMAFIAYWGYTAGYDVVEYGDEVDDIEQERVLIVCNHQTTADVPTLLAALHGKRDACRSSMWIMDIMFKWSPFGMVSQVHGDHFITQGRSTREHELEKLMKHLTNVYWSRDRRWIFVFPEGGFLYKRRESSQKYSEKNGFEHLEHVTLPRMGAVKTILEAVGPRENNGSVSERGTASSDGLLQVPSLSGGEGDANDALRKSGSVQLLKDTVGAIREKKYIKETQPRIKYVLDITIGYPGDEALGLDTLMFGTRKNCEICVFYKIYDACKVPFRDEDSLRDWLYERFYEKEPLLDNYYRTGVFAPGEIGRRVVFPYHKIFLQYLYWFVVGCVQYKVYRYCLGFLFQWLYDGMLLGITPSWIGI